MHKLHHQLPILLNPGSTAIGLRLSLLLILLLALSACSSAPKSLRGEYPPLAPQTIKLQDLGTSVRWGGVLLATQPEQERTCFEVLSKSLSSSMRPRNEDQTSGRFIACNPGFHDPQVFVKGREVTVIGQLQAIDERKVGEYSYRYPVLAADFMTMWPERPDIIIQDFHDPFYHPWYWGPYWGPYYGAYGFGAPYPRSHVRTTGSRERIEIGTPPSVER